VGFYVEKVNLIADSRFAFQGWKSQVADAEDTGYTEEESESKV
jgi:hypothetical protein